MLVLSHIKLRLRKLKALADNPHYVLWAVSADENYLRLGEATPAGRNQAKIEAKAALSDFGLLVTVQNSVGETPAGDLVAKVAR